MYTAFEGDEKEDKYVSYTTTYKSPTKQECIEEIVDCAKRLAKLKWFNDKSFLKSRIIYYASILNDFEEIKNKENKEYLLKKFKIKDNKTL